MIESSTTTRSGRRTPGFVLFVTGLAVLCAVAPVTAQSSFDTSPQPSLPPADLAIDDGAIQLSLDDAIAIALQRNLTIALERLTSEQFELGITQAKGIFDLRLDTFAQWADSTSPTADALQGADVLQSESQVLNLGLSQLTAFGGEASFSFDNNRSQTNNRFATLNPSFSVFAGLSYSQPLLRNFGKLATKRGILVAKIRDTSNQAFFEQQVIDVVQRVENAYWNLVEAKDQLRVAEAALDLAKELHRRNQVQVEVGTLPPLELVQSEANIATREEEIITARTSVGNAGDSLRQLLNLEQGAAWEADIVPTTDARTEIDEIDLDEAIRAALANRRELERQRLEIERLDVEARYARNQMRPRLDLSVSYGYSGIGGDVLDQEPVIDPVTGQPQIDPVTGGPLTRPIVVDEGGWSDALDQVTQRDFDRWAVGVTFAYPLQNRAAKSARVSADIELEKGEVTLTQLEQSVITEVRTAVRQVRSAAQQIESAGVSRRLQQRNLEAEQKRYENGMSTSFQVTQIQDDLARAANREVIAIASYRRQLADYYRVIGRLLEAKGITIDGGEEAGGEE